MPFLTDIPLHCEAQLSSCAERQLCHAALWYQVQPVTICNNAMHTKYKRNRISKESLGTPRRY